MPRVSFLPDVELDYLRKRNRESTQRLLGETIAISDEDWQAPCLLPGWTRAHIATHIARGADALRRLAAGAASGAGTDYSDSGAFDIERGSERSALDLQIDLDTSAGQLNAALDALEEEQWSVPVLLPHGLRVPLDVVPLARLAEVELHRVDLDYEYRIESIDPTVAGWLLTFCARCVEADGDRPRYRLQPHDAPEVVVGDGSGPAVTGHTHALLGWLTGRQAGAEVGGADGPQPLL